MEKNKEQVICPLCSKLSATYFSEKKGYKLYKCSLCRLLFVYPLPGAIDVYNKSYFSGAEHGFGYVDYDADKEPMVPTFNKYLDIIWSLGIKSGKLLDVGAATGFFMRLAHSGGFEVSGVELSDFAANKGRLAGLNIITGDLISQNFLAESFDVVTMFDVLEHVPDPKSLLTEAKRILRVGGLLVINTPDAESLWARILGPRWHLIMPPEHIHYFSPKNLGDYLAKNGFVLRVSNKIGKKFTLQYILKMLHKWLGYKVFSGGFASKVSIPINLRDNFFMILEKKI